MRALLIIALLVALPGLVSASDLDTAEISRLYFDGEFPAVIEKLEAFRKSNRNPTKSGKIFTYKYLSVVYAANPETQAKAESFMVQLLKLAPTIELFDMYVSDSIKAIFRRVKDDHHQRQEYTQSYDHLGQPLDPGEPEPMDSGAGSDPRPEVATKSSKAWLWWSAGGVAIAAAVTSYILLNADDSSKEKKLERNL